MSSKKEAELYTDGGCLNYQVHEKRLSGGFRRTTNSRMESMVEVSDPDHYDDISIDKYSRQKHDRRQ